MEEAVKSMSRLGVEASKAGESLRKLFLELNKLKQTNRKGHKPPYKYHR